MSSRDSAAPVWRYALVFFAVGQPITIGISAVLGVSFDDENPDGPVLIPFPPAFAIWGLIVTLAAIYAVWQATARTDPAGRNAIARALTLTTSGFCAWIAVASVPALSAITVPVFLAMGVGLVLAARAARYADMGSWPSSIRALLWMTIGTYLGWTTIAVWVNLSTVLYDLGAPVRSPWGFAWQLLLAAAATGTAAVMLSFLFRIARPLMLIFGFTTVYALAFAAVGAATRDAPVPAGVATILALVMAVSTSAFAVGDRRVSRTDIPR